MKPEEFIEEIKEDALEIEKEHDIPASIIIAQAALETGWLGHEIRDKETGINSYNLFGIKADKNWDGPTVKIDTHEYKDGRRFETEGKFRAYKSYQESIMDHMSFLLENPRYEKTLEADNPIEFARRLQEAGYATDPNYAEKLISIMRKYDLLDIRPEKDIDYKGHWAEDSIEEVMELGIFNKTSEFRPDDKATRAELATVVDRLIGFIVSEKREF